ncbi:ubiquitin-conjugating enzyme/RWD-like protein [Tanacetum coccineum]
MDFQNTEYTILPTEDGAGSSGSTSVQSSEIEAHETYLKKSLEKKRDSHVDIFTMEGVRLDLLDAGIHSLAALDNKALEMNEASVPSQHWANNVEKELDQLNNGLPTDSIYVRSYTGMIDLMWAAIIGKKGTPYDNGLFFFDVCFPSTYPQTPPLISYHSGGPRINPNLMFDKLRLSLPGTTGRRMIRCGRTIVYKEHACLLYQKNTLIKSLKTMVFIMNKPPKNFEEFVGVRVGGIHNGGALVRIPMLTSSTTFEKDLISCMKLLVIALKKVEAE